MRVWHLSGKNEQFSHVGQLKRGKRACEECGIAAVTWHCEVDTPTAAAEGPRNEWFHLTHYSQNYGIESTSLFRVNHMKYKSKTYK